MLCVFEPCPVKYDNASGLVANLAAGAVNVLSVRQYDESTSSLRSDQACLFCVLWGIMIVMDGLCLAKLKRSTSDRTRPIRTSQTDGLPSEFTTGRAWKERS